MCLNGKMRPIVTIPEIGGWIGENVGKGWIQLWYIVRTFVNVTLYPQDNNNKINKYPFTNTAFICMFNKRIATLIKVFASPNLLLCCITLS
jgi:hypothetical protein